jgi:hypothetical protein
MQALWGTVHPQNLSKSLAPSNSNSPLFTCLRVLDIGFIQAILTLQGGQTEPKTLVGTGRRAVSQGKQEKKAEYRLFLICTDSYQESEPSRELDRAPSTV